LAVLIAWSPSSGGALGALNVVSVLVAIVLGYAAMAGFSTSVDVNAR
jgi:hypothetical protein